MRQYATLLDAVHGWTLAAASCADARPGSAEMLVLAALDTLSSIREDAARQRREPRAASPIHPTFGATIAHA